MKHYKVYLNLYNKNDKRIEKEQKDLIIFKLVEQDKTLSYSQFSFSKVFQL